MATSPLTTNHLGLDYLELAYRTLGLCYRIQRVEGGYLVLVDGKHEATAADLHAAARAAVGMARGGEGKNGG